jgi:hypothetical protein
MSACRMGPLLVAWLLSATILGGVRECTAARIEAIRGKSYTLTRQHGPWMIMVASFHTTAADGQTDEGKTPLEAANELVYELRTKGIPAYTYEIEPESEMLQTVDRLGQPVRRRNLRRVKSLCVLAGNYPSFEDDVAQKTLVWIKKYDPQCLKEGVTFKPTPGRPLPLSGAFLCMNPLLSPEEVAARRVDPFVRQLNAGVRYSLSENPGEYTLLVAHFGGKSYTQLKNQPTLLEFLKDNDLDEAARQANDLAAALRQDLDPQPESPFRNLEAYVWHDLSESIVTVGSFRGPDDPAIQRYLQMFTGSIDPVTGQIQSRYLAIGGPKQPSRVWPFIPRPQLIPVPKVR